MISFERLMSRGKYGSFSGKGDGMISFERLKILKDIVDDLAKGKSIGALVEGDFVRQCFSDISEILALLLYNGEILKVDKRFKFPFFLSNDEKALVVISKKSLTIKDVTNNINVCRDTSKVKRLRATQITRWLDHHGYLETINLDDNFTYRKATVIGEHIGIESHFQKNSMGNEYAVNLYNVNAQKFILENLDKIIFFSF